MPGVTDKAHETSDGANARIGAGPVRIAPPQTIRLAVLAMGVQIFLTLVATALLWGYTSDLSKQLIKSNKALKVTDKHRKNPDTYLAGTSALMHDLHVYRQQTTFQALIACALFALAAYAIWRGSGMARWLYTASAVIFSIYVGVSRLAAGPPVVPNALSFVVALAAIAAIVLLTLAPSLRFFAAVKAARPPAPLRGAAGSGAPRPAGFRGLFAPPPPREPRAPATRPSRRPADTRPATRAAGAAADDGSTSSNGRGKPKARTGAPGVDVSSDVAESGEDTPARGRGKSRRV
jgi:hypothetical protein